MKNVIILVKSKILVLIVLMMLLQTLKQKQLDAVENQINEIPNPNFFVCSKPRIEWIELVLQPICKYDH